MDETPTWTAPGFAPSHDYDAAWDHEVLDEVPSGAPEMLDELWRQLQDIDDPDGVIIPLRVAFASIAGPDVGRYAFGTADAPVVTIDWAKLNADLVINPREDVTLTLLHELRHAWQERCELLMDDGGIIDVEADAETWAVDVLDSLHGLDGPSL